MKRNGLHRASHAKTVFRILAFMAVLCLGWGSAHALDAAFDETKGTLSQLTDPATGHPFLSPDAGLSLWFIEWMDGTVLGPEGAASFSRETGENGNLILRWSGLGVPEAPGLSVEAQVACDPAGGAIRWRIAVENVGERVIRTVTFPRIGPLAPQDGETLAVPQWIGEKTTQARAMLNPASGHPGRWAWEYPGILSMQFMTLYGASEPGLLLSSNDTGHQRKQFAAFGDGAGAMGIEVVHFAAVGEKKTGPFAPAYDVLLDAFSGDWYTAAAQYRQWAKEAPWTRQSRLRTGKTPDWVRDTGLWIWNRGVSSGVLEPAIALQRQVDMPVSVFWHWWHGCAYDDGFPEYLPPREGEASFKQAVEAARAQGIHAIVYMNQRLWGMNTKSWKERGAERFAVKGPNGAIHPEVYNKFTKAPCVSMCMGTPFWRNTYASLAEQAIRDLGVAGIYMDQACSSLACYDPSHGHPLGGGAYWMEGFRALEADIRKRCTDAASIGLAGEGCGEAWLPHLDMMLSLQVSMERYAAPGIWEPIPLFNAVYHDAAVQYGNYSSLTRPPYDELWPKEFAPTHPLELLDRKFATQFRMEQARSLVWGQQPCLANFQEEQLEKRAGEIGYFLRIARLRQDALKYLRDGTFLRPPALAVAEETIPISRLSIYAGQQDAVREYTKPVQPVFASAWQAQDGDIAIVLANIVDKEIPVAFTLSGQEYPLPEKGILCLRDETGRQKIAETERDGVEFNLTLPPCTVRLYELTSDTPRP